MSFKAIFRLFVITGAVAFVLNATDTQAQTTSSAARVFRVAKGKESSQPVAPSTVIIDTEGNLTAGGQTLNLTADQQTKISAMNPQAAALQAERAKLWSEYRAITSRKDYSDAIAVSQVRPRVRRIVAINEQLSTISTTQEKQLRSLLSPTQRTQVVKMVAAAKSTL